MAGALGRSGKFKDLLESLKGISPNLLANRLKRLEREGIVERFFYSQHPPRAEYRFTAKGEELRSVVRAIAEWGYRHQLSDAQRPPGSRPGPARRCPPNERREHLTGVAKRKTAERSLGGR